MTGSRRFEGKTAIVTGGTRGIGREIALRLGREGASVIVVARNATAEQEAFAELGARVRFVVGSVQDPETASRAVAIAEANGGLDVLVNNAGVDHTGDVVTAREAEVRKVLEINFLGALWMLQRAAAAMRRGGGGAIVNVTSRLASIGVPTMSIYAATKGALLALTRSAAVELASDGIRVNAVAPGLTETALFREWIDDQDDPVAFRRQVAATIPQGRFGTPEEVAAAVSFLASDECLHITGASLALDGGYTAA